MPLLTRFAPFASLTLAVTSKNFSGKANALHRSHEVNSIPLAEIEVQQYEIDGIFL